MDFGAEKRDIIMSTIIETGTATNTGMVRTHNEDSRVYLLQGNKLCMQVIIRSRRGRRDNDRLVLSTPNKVQSCSMRMAD